MIIASLNIVTRSMSAGYRSSLHPKLLWEKVYCSSQAALHIFYRKSFTVSDREMCLIVRICNYSKSNYTIWRWTELNLSVATVTPELQYLPQSVAPLWTRSSHIRGVKGGEMSTYCSLCQTALLILRVPSNYVISHHSQINVLCVGVWLSR